MSQFGRSSSWCEVLCGFTLFLAILILVSSIYDGLKPPFFTTHSPDGTYAVNLYGQKERPAFFTVEVGAVVLKDGQPFWPYETLHTGDFMDLSFELGWPDHRWIGNNILQLYSEKNFSELKHPERHPVTLVLVNKTEKAIRHLRIYSDNDKFLGFDLASGLEIKLTTAPSKGDRSGVWVAGEFDDGRTFEKGSAFDVRNISHPIVWGIVITDEGVGIHTSSRDNL